MSRRYLVAVAAVLTTLGASSAVSAFAESRRAERTADPYIQYVVKRSATRSDVARGYVSGRIRSLQQSSGDTFVTLDSGEVLRVRSTASVFYRGERFNVADLEVGDEIRATALRGSTSRDVSVRAIEVVRSVSDPTTADRRRDDVEMRGAMVGEVESVNPRTESFVMAMRNGRRVTVDAYRSRGVDLDRLQRGDRVAVVGTFDGMGVLRATRIDRGDRGANEGRSMRRDDRDDRREQRRAQDRDDDEDDDDNDDND